MGNNIHQQIFYKIHLMYELTKRYEVELYLDFDVVPITSENIFTYFDINKGIACRVNHEKDGKYVHDFLSFMLIMYIFSLHFRQLIFHS